MLFFIFEVWALVQIPPNRPSRYRRSNFLLEFIGRNLLVARKPRSTPVVIRSQSCRSPWTLRRTIIFGIFDIIIHYAPGPAHQTRNISYRLALVLVGYDLPHFEIGKLLSAAQGKMNDPLKIVLMINSS